MDSPKNAAGKRWVVCKFGGTSVSSRKTWGVIVQHVRKLLGEGLRVCVIVSAVSQVTNYLEKVVEGLKNETAVLKNKGKAGALDETTAREETDKAVKWIVDRHMQHCKDLDVDPAVVQPWLDELERLVEGIRLTGDSASNRLRGRMLTFGELMSSHIGHKFLNKEVGDASSLPVGLVDARQMLFTNSNQDLNAEKTTNDADRYLNADVTPFALDLDGAAAVLRESGDLVAADNADAASNTSNTSSRYDIRALPFLTHDVVISQGFVASTPIGEPCVLGRGGSDTSGSLFGAMLSAVVIEIWTDVDGMYTSDPRHVPNARLVEELSYREAQELAAMGAKVLHPRCLGPASWAQIPVEIHNTFNPKQEKLTRIVAPEALAQGGESRIMAIAKRTGQVLVTISTVDMWGTSGFLSRVFQPFDRLGISVDLIATSQYAVSMTLDYIPDGVNGEPFRNLIRALRRQGNVTVETDCCVVSVVGRKLRSILHNMADAFRELERYNLLLLSESTEDLNMSFVLGKSNFSIDALVLNLHSVLLEKKVPAAPLKSESVESAAGLPMQVRKPRGASFGAPMTSTLLQAVQPLSIARASQMDPSSWVQEEVAKYASVPTPFAVIDLATLMQRAQTLSVFPMGWSSQPAVLRSVYKANPEIVFLCRNRQQVLDLCSILGSSVRVYLQNESAGPLSSAIPLGVKLVSQRPDLEQVDKAASLLAESRVVVASVVEAEKDAEWLAVDVRFQAKDGHRVHLLTDLPERIKEVRALGLYDDALETILVVESEGEQSADVKVADRVIFSGISSALFSTKSVMPVEQYFRFSD